MTKVLIIGLGYMGQSHALAHHMNPNSEIVGLVNRTERGLPDALKGYPRFNRVDAGMAQMPELVVIATYSSSHADLAIQAMEAGADVFVEKPLATTVIDAERVVTTAKNLNRKLVVGYILRHHPSWMRLINEARNLGGPYVFRMNLNQQSSGDAWMWHKNLIDSLIPIVDCGVHYVDVMCQLTGAKPVRVHGIGASLWAETEKQNYGHLHVTFDDGSVGWYEAGWGPMMSETAFFVKDIISPHGSVSIVETGKGVSSDIKSHTKVGSVLVHKPVGDKLIEFPDEPGHQDLCDSEQAFLLYAIANDIDLTRHMHDAVQSLRICLGADESIRSGKIVTL